MTNLLQYSKDENGRLKTDLENIRQLYNDSQKDNILLRNSLSRQEETKKVNENGVNDKEKLIIQLEESLAKVSPIIISSESICKKLLKFLAVNIVLSCLNDQHQKK